MRRVSPQGTITTVAGTGAPGFAGDGGAATGAELRGPTGLSVTPQGSLLIADTGNNRIRMVSPAGIISTRAGDGRRGFRGDGGDALLASLSSPSAAVAAPGGELLIADAGNNRVRRVSAQATIGTAVGDGTPGLVGDQYVSQRGVNLFNGDGGPPGLAAIAHPAGIDLSAGGGYIVSSGDRVRFVASGRAPRLAVAVRATVAARRKPRIEYVVTRRSRVSLELIRGHGRRVIRRLARPGRNRFRLSRVHPGAFGLRLVAKGTNGAVATDEAGVVLGHRLGVAVATAAVNACCGFGEPVVHMSGHRGRAQISENEGEVAGACHRVRARRVDCRLDDYGEGFCEHLVAVTLRRSGQLVGRNYRCGKVRRHPRYTSPSFRIPLI